MKDEIKKKLIDRVFESGLMAMFVSCYLFFISLGSSNISKDVFILDLKVFAFILLMGSILLFEKSYKNDSGTIFITALEVALLSFITLYMQYIYFINPHIDTLNYILILVFLFYYIIKAYVLYVVGKKEHKDSLSDIKEILKDEEQPQNIMTEPKPGNVGVACDATQEEKSDKPKKKGAKRAKKKGDKE